MSRYPIQELHGYKYKGRAYSQEPNDSPCSLTSQLPTCMVGCFSRTQWAILLPVMQPNRRTIYWASLGTTHRWWVARDISGCEIDFSNLRIWGGKYLKRQPFLTRGLDIMNWTSNGELKPPSRPSRHYNHIFSCSFQKYIISAAELSLSNAPQWNNLPSAVVMASI